MIDFGNFYSLIAKNHLSHWLETLPAQIANSVSYTHLTLPTTSRV